MEHIGICGILKRCRAGELDARYYSKGKEEGGTEGNVIDSACQLATTLLSCTLLHGACKTCYQPATFRHAYSRNENNLIYATCLSHLFTGNMAV